jgi:hypothetical protein
MQNWPQSCSDQKTHVYHVFNENNEHSKNCIAVALPAAVAWNLLIVDSAEQAVLLENF